MSHRSLVKQGCKLKADRLLACIAVHKANEHWKKLGAYLW
jgi:hypothetical protein